MNIQDPGLRVDSLTASYDIHTDTFEVNFDLNGIKAANSILRAEASISLAYIYLGWRFALSQLEPSHYDEFVQRSR
jgi:hypothetical protein